MEYFVEFGGYGAVVGVGGHDIGHVCPPFAADFGVCNGIPAFFIFDFDISKKLVGLWMVKYGIIVSTVFFEGGRQFIPNRLVAPGVFFHFVRMDAHHEGFANHDLLILLVVFDGSRMDFNPVARAYLFKFAGLQQILFTAFQPTAAGEGTARRRIDR